ncbi:MMPL family transporter [Nocardioides insulae]|uniref:MMPL family transporter n=1 Tax=Nocardioides insulae TaxID=394734 RepID=UPI00041D78F9|nr:MMPL family transporter [Nocardioides insulae]
MSQRSALAALPTRAARWSATHPWSAIGLWLAFVVAAVALSALIPTQQPTDADYRVGESGRAEAMVDEANLDGPPVENVLITATDGVLDRNMAEDAAAALTTQMTPVAGVTEVGAPMWNEDDTAVLVPVTLEESEDLDVAPMLAVTDNVQSTYPDLEVSQTGGESIDEAINERVAEDLRTAELFSLPITFVLMLLAFGALIAAGIPVLLAATSVAATIGIAAPISLLVPAEPTVISMIVLIGMAVGVDYSLFYLKREREERAAGRTTLDSVDLAAQTSGHAIVVSGLAVIAALAGLFVLTDTTFNSLAVGAITVVAVAVLGSITVLPALLAKLGRWVDRPRVPLLWRLNRRIGRGGISGRVLGPVVRHPLVALLVAVVPIVLLTVPALGMKTHEAGLNTLPPDIPEVATMAAVTEEFPQEGSTADVVVRAPASDRSEVAAALSGLEDDAAATGEFTDTDAEIQVSADGTTSRIQLAMPFDPESDRADEAIKILREDLAPQALDGVTDEWAVGGDTATSVDFTDKLRERLPWVIGFVLLLTLLMMGFAFRSIPIALISAALNLASVAVVFGVMTVVFQHGVGEELLDFTSPGYLISWVPIFVMVVLVGLSMDYHVFVLSRVKEYVDQGLPTRAAVRRGIADTAGTVTSAAAVMISVFALFATLSMMEMKMMGVGLSAAILIDATLIRLVALPALLVLLGDRVWWPRRPADLPPAAVVEPEHLAGVRS